MQSPASYGLEFRGSSNGNYLLTWGLDLGSKSWRANYGQEPNWTREALLMGGQPSESVIQNIPTGKSYCSKKVVRI